MNLNEFAEQIVFGTTLEDKLMVPGRLSRQPSSHRLPNIESLRCPGRPAELKMRHNPGEGTQSPGEHELESEQARGQLLHFLANHELLATELMALVLLKFPDAPHAFRQGVFVTLQEEQEHTRMYLRRMKECGVEFGEFPVSGQFWRVVEPMKSPMDFVSRLSLTFEQANLDFSLHFSKLFRRIGDAKTADLLQTIYEDEIGHVQHGLHWFRQWKDPELSDWDAYQASLEFPMSPQRGRGPNATFNREGRVQAGLTNNFIDAIEIFRQSRGRAPTVRWFDPATEACLAGELTQRDANVMKQLGEDLELVMVPMSKQDDVILVNRVPTRKVQKRLIDDGFDLPEFKLFSDQASLVNRKLHDLVPWAWTPKNHEMVQALASKVRHPAPAWQPNHIDLFRKTWGSAKLGEWISQSQSCNELPEWSTPNSVVGIPISKINEVEDGLKEIAGRGYENAIFKLDLATSGRGQRRFGCNGLTAEDHAWLASLPSSDSLDSSGSPTPIGIIEPELDRVLDLSFLWHLSRGKNEPRFLGWTLPLITPGRRYAGTRFRTSMIETDQALKIFVLKNHCQNITQAVEWVESRLIAELNKRGFEGYFGVDAFVCRDENNEFKIKPFVELNPRMTMGHVALQLKKHLAPGVEGEFRIFSKRELQPILPSLQQMPLVKANDGPWKSGVVWLGDVDNYSKLLPAFLVGKEVVNLVRRNCV